MGKQSRLRALRREERRDLARQLPPGQGDALRVLRALHRTIQEHCYESGRRCWEYLLEMLAQASGWPTESSEAKHLWDKMADEPRWLEFIQTWLAEVEWAKANGSPFSEPIGQLLEEVNGTNDHLGQFLTPMSVVRVLNAVSMDAPGVPNPNGMPTRRGLDPCCGTGRFMIDALIHNDNLVMHGVDLDLWMLRAAMLNVRLLSRWTSMSVPDPADRFKPLHVARRMIKRFEQIEAAADLKNPFAMLGQTRPEQPDEHKGGNILIIGGRSIFIHGDALVVDLEYTPNWLCAGWAWSPHPWTGNLKMKGFYGSFDDWEKAGRPALQQHGNPDEPLQFDYSMAPPG